MEPAIVILVLLFAVSIRVLLGIIDKRRIREAASKRGWRRVLVYWSPFAPGWFFEKGERHYRVLFRDEDGEEAELYCKTGLLTGVYWRD